MQALEALFPHSDFTPLALIVLLPLLGAIINGLFGKRLGKEAVSLLGLSVVFVPFLFSVFTFLALTQVQDAEHAARFVWKGWDWLRLSQVHGGSTMISVSLSVDALSGTMALVVTGVGFLIHLYSTKYMEEDPSYYRFFTYLNLFIFSMLLLILADNLPVLFVGWEGVGLCSYLLIGFWFEDEKNAAAGKKAFITNRIGDFGLLVAMGLILYYVGALDWSSIEGGASQLLAPVQIWPIGPRFPPAEVLGKIVSAVHLDGAALTAWLNMPRHISAATMVGWALFLGAAGKSAQLPLYVWLPDAMAGPTPVSALIHAATMVTAGVYLVCRLSPIFVLSPAAMFTVALVGALTAVFAATIAFAQTDIKKVLAYSTVSQLGYMFLGAGVGAFSAGFFHVITHAFFKACLFLGAGSVIHAMHARIHDNDASQDMRNMGGLYKYLPYTFVTFLVACAAIVGFPFTSGFFSKDEILLKAYTSFIGEPIPGNHISAGQVSVELFRWPSWAGTLLYSLGLFAAVMTAFYMARLFFGIFFGDFKGWKIVKKWRAPAHDDHHSHDHAHGHAHAHEPLEGPTPHESPWQMWVPLVILAALAGVFGFLNAPVLHLTPFDHWLEPVFASSASHVHLIEDAESKMYPFLGLAVVAFGVGVGAAYWIYIVKLGEPAQEIVTRAPRFHRWALEKWRVDEFYEETIIGAVDSLGEFLVWADKWLVDGILARLTAFIVSGSGTLLRYAQTGRVQAYAAVMVIGLAGVGWFVVTPRAEVREAEDRATGAYTLTAAPGLGYSYRWDQNQDGKWDSDDFGSQAEVKFNLNAGTTRVVKLEVKNAFGRVAQREFPISRPKPDATENGADGNGQPSPGANPRLPAPTGRRAPVAKPREEQR